MTGKPFERKYTVHYYETGIDGKLRVDSLMHYFEELALLQSEAMGVGLEYYRRHGLIWLLHRFDIRLHRLPGFGQKVVVKTLPSSVYRYLGFRKFSVHAPDGGLMAEADSAWLFVDTARKRPVRVNNDMKNAYGYSGLAGEKLHMDDIPAVEGPLGVKQFRVRTADIDINRHVNNVVYVQWAMEAIPARLHENCRLQRIRIAWLKETLAGSRVRVLTRLSGQGPGVDCLQSVRGGDGQEKCRILSRWVPQA